MVKSRYRFDQHLICVVFIRNLVKEPLGCLFVNVLKEFLSEVPAIQLRLLVVFV